MKKLLVFILFGIFFLTSCEKDITEPNFIEEVRKSDEYRTYLNDVLFKIIDLSDDIGKIDEDILFPEANNLLIRRIEKVGEVESLSHRANYLVSELNYKFPKLKELEAKELSSLFEEDIIKLRASSISRGGDENCNNSCWEQFYSDTGWAAAQLWVGLTVTGISAGTGQVGGVVGGSWLITTAVRDIVRSSNNKSNCVKACP